MSNDNILQAENAIIGAALETPELWHAILGELSESDLVNNAARQIMHAARMIAADGDVPDATTIADCVAHAYQAHSIRTSPLLSAARTCGRCSSWAIQLPNAPGKVMNLMPSLVMQPSSLMTSFAMDIANCLIVRTPLLLFMISVLLAERSLSPRVCLP